MENIKKINSAYGNFPEHNRFDYPDYMVRVTAGNGGESYLIFGSEKTALYDTGMAYCHEGVVDNIEKALADRGRNTIDYALMSHTHYDHIGALPYILKRWPDATVVGSKKARQVFASDGAKATMKRLGEAARDNFTDSKEPVDVDGFRVDMVVGEGDRIDMGDRYFVVMETKGHTNCSLTYVLEPQSLMFTCESTGVMRNPGNIHTAILKSYKDSIDSAERCKAYGAKQLISPHYGIIPEDRTDYYFDLYIECAEAEKDFILKCRDEGMSRDEIFEAFDERNWSDERGRAQPREAFEENAKYSIMHILNNF